MEQVTNLPVVSARSNVFQATHMEPVCLPDYATIEDYFDHIGWPEYSKPLTFVFLNGLAHEDWGYIVQPGDDVKFVVIPGGGGGDGKQAMALIASIAITIFSAGAGAPLAAALGYTGATAANIATAILGVVGNLLVGAVFKPSVASNNTLDGVSEASDPYAPSAMITGQSNNGRIGGVIPKIFGAHRVYPDLASQPYITKHACRQVLHALYSTGYGKVEIDIGTAEFGGVASKLLPTLQLGLANFGRVHMGGEDSTATGPYNYYQGRHESISVGYTFPVMSGDLTDETYIQSIATIVQVANNSSLVYMDFVFPSGLFQTDSAGNIQPHRASITIQREKSLGSNTWADIQTGDLDGDGVSSCSRADDGQDPYIVGTIENEDFTQKYWGDLNKVVSGGGGGTNNNLLPSNTYMFDPDAGTALSFPGTGLWNSGEGEDNASGGPGRNVILTQRTVPGGTDVYQRAQNEDYGPGSTGRFNIHFDLFPNSGSSFARGTYRITFHVSSAETRNPLAGEGNDQWTDSYNITGYAFGRAEDGSKGWESSNTRTISRSSNDPSSFGFNFTLDSDIDYGDYIRIGFIADVQGNYTANGYVRFRFHALEIIFEEPDDVETPVVQTVVQIGVKNTLESPVHKRQEIPADGSNFYPAIKVGEGGECNSVPNDYYDDYVWDDCLLKISQRPYRVVGTPELVGTTDDRSLYNLTLDRQLIETGADYYITETVYENGFHVTGITRNPLHFGATFSCSTGDRFRIYKSSPTPGRGVDGVVLNAINCESAIAPLTMPPNSGNLAYGIIGLQAEADNLIGQQLKPLSVEVYGWMRSFDVHNFQPDPDDPDTWVKHYDDTKPLNQNDSNATSLGDPAWTFMNVLMGNAADRPIGILGSQYMGDFFDLEAFSRWSRYCTANNFQFHLVVDSITTIGELLQTIAAVGKAVPIRPDGKYSILFDGDPLHFNTDPDGKLVPVSTQLVTPNNSWGLEASIDYVKKTHALKMKYLPLMSEKENTVICYDKGFDIDGSDYDTPGDQPPWKATKFETISLPGVTDVNHAAALGHYYLAESRLRRERLSLSMDIENLISIEGDVIAVAHDVLKMGGITVYVTDSIVVGDKNHVRVNQPIPQPALDQSIGIRFRYFGDDDEAKLTDVIPAVVYPADPTNIIYDATINNSPSLVPNDGGMLIWGEIDTITQDYQITNIKYSNDLSARIELLEYIPDVVHATGRSTIGETPTEGEVATPTNVTLDIDWFFNGTEWIMTYVVDWDDMPGITGMGGIYRVNFGGAVTGNQIVTDVSQYRGNPQTLIPGLEEMQVCVTAIDLFGNESEPPLEYEEGLGCATVPIVCPGDVPPNVSEISSNSESGQVYLSWQTPSVQDPVGFMIRYMTDEEYKLLPEDEDGVPIVTILDGQPVPGVDDDFLDKTVRNLTVPVSVGEDGLVFCIWVYSACGYYSESPAVTVLDFKSTNGVKPVADEVLWPSSGTYVNTVNDSNVLRLEQDLNDHFAQEGWFLPAYYEDYGTDQGKVTLSGNVGQPGRVYFDLLMSQMVPLEIAKPLAGVPDKQLLDRRYAELYRWVNPQLSSSGAVEELLLPINDKYRNLCTLRTSVTANRVYYGIRLVTDVVNISPTVTSSSVSREYLLSNPSPSGHAELSVLVGAASSVTQVTFQPEFPNFLNDALGIPKVSVTTENLPGSVVWDIINITHAGFQVEIRHAPAGDYGDSAFDWTASGYGEFTPYP